MTWKFREDGLKDGKPQTEPMTSGPQPSTEQKSTAEWLERFIELMTIERTPPKVIAAVTEEVDAVDEFINDPDLDAILDDIAQEVSEAVEKFPTFASPHEGISVIREEFEELWDEIKANRGRQGSARKEAIQLAAMAVRYLLDIDPLE